MPLVASRPVADAPGDGQRSRLLNQPVVPVKVVVGVTLAQFAAMTAYIVAWVFGDAADPFSIGAWVFTLGPPLVFGLLSCVGLLIAGLVKSSIWRVLLLSVGCIASMSCLIVSLLALPLLLLGSVSEYLFP